MAARKTKTRRVYVRAKRRRSRPQFKIPLLMIAGMLPALGNIHRAGSQRIHGQGNYIGDAGVEALRILVGIDPRPGVQQQFNFGWTFLGSVPILAAALVSKFASRMGVNRAFGRLPIKL